MNRLEGGPFQRSWFSSHDLPGENRGAGKRGGNVRLSIEESFPAGCHIGNGGRNYLSIGKKEGGDHGITLRRKEGKCFNAKKGKSIPKKGVEKRNWGKGISIKGCRGESGIFQSYQRGGSGGHEGKGPSAFEEGVHDTGDMLTSFTIIFKEGKR